MKVSSVSPERWLTMTPQPLVWASLQLKKSTGRHQAQFPQPRRPCPALPLPCRGTHAWMDSVTEPIWLTFSRRQLQAFCSTAFWMRLGLVTVKSSPTIWICTCVRNFFQVSQSSWSKGSSMETTGSRGGGQQPQSFPLSSSPGLGLVTLHRCPPPSNSGCADSSPPPL